MVRYEDHVVIATPEGVDLTLTLAGLGSRFAAALIDGLIKGAIAFAGVVVLGLTSAALGTLGARATSIGLQSSLTIATIALFLLLFGYDVAFETLASGRTPGKRAAGLRVLRSEGGTVGFLASATRNILRLVDWLPFAFAAGIAAILLSPRNQRLGDMAADTIVVREAHASPGQRWDGDARGGGHGLEGWDVSAIGEAELAAVRCFLLRRSSLTPAARTRLARELEQRLRARVAGAPPELEPEEFLDALTAAKARRL
jgi:uncharacterized RDD family membrane protein YckC